MRYLIPILIVLTLLTITTYSQTAPQYSYKDFTGLDPFTTNDLGLRSNVHTVEEKDFQKSGKIYEPASELYLEFDASGKLIKSKSALMYLGIDMGTISRTYTYNASGRLEKYESTELGNTDKETSTYKYDDKGNMVLKEYLSEGENTKTSFEYNDKKRVTAVSYFHAGKTTPYSIKRITYDAQNRITEIATENTADKSMAQSIYTYTGDSKLPASYTYKGKQDFNFSGADAALIEYNASGNLTGYYPTAGGQRLNLNSTTYIYEYDAQQNWTKKTAKGFGDSYTTRTITYFKETEAASYKKTITDIIQPTSASFSTIAKASIEETRNKEELLKSVKTYEKDGLAALAKLQNIPELAGNNSKNLAIEYMKFLTAPATIEKMKTMIFNMQNMGMFREMGGDASKYRTALSQELAKLQ